MKNVHVLNGDCLKNQFPKDIEGEIIVWRECLVSGPVSESNFFENRKTFIHENFGEKEADYDKKVVSEFKKIKEISENSNVYFWFEDDLFCQVNLWFLLANIDIEKLNLFAVFPIIKDESERWKGFGNSTEQDLEESFKNTEQISLEDYDLGKQLWKAFSENNIQNLNELSFKNSTIFRELKSVLKANEDRFNGKLEKKLLDLNSKHTSFEALFQEFNEKYGVYGFGDSQVQQLIQQL
jgi:hypothetical protein